MSPGNNFKPGTLAARWRKNPDGMGPDLVSYYPSAPDGHFINYVLNSSVLEELKNRGYDLDTLEFTIRRKCTK